MTHYHFPFEKLTEYSEALEALAIFAATFFIVYTLASLYYWSWSDMFTIKSEPLKRDPLWRSKTTAQTTTTYQTPNLDLDKEIAKVEAEQKRDNKTKRKRSNKRVRQNVAPKNDKDLT